MLSYLLSCTDQFFNFFDYLSGRIRFPEPADVIAAQKAVVAVARRLAAEGTIVFGSSGGAGDDDYV